MNGYLRRLICVMCLLVGAAAAQNRIIEITADKDSRYKVPGQSKPEVTLKAGEQITLRITANRGKSWNRDGSIHGFTLMRASNRMKVPGWNLALLPGTHDFDLTAPSEPGDYIVVCTVICSEEHESMNMKLVIVP